MFRILFILFTVVPTLELYLLFKAGQHIGGVNTLSIVIITGFVGAWLAKAQGRAVMQQFQHEMRQNIIPADTIVHGFLIFGGGLLLLTPGFITDITGLCMVVPGPRHLIAKLVKRFVQKGFQTGFIQTSSVHVHGESQTNPFSESDPKTQDIEADYIEDSPS